MRSPEWHREWEEWLSSRPPDVQEVARRLPPGCALDQGGMMLYLLGYQEQEGGVGLIMSPINPAVDYDGANDVRVYICAEDTKRLRTE